MDEMTNMIAQKTGLSQEQAKMAAQAAMDFMMSKLPAPLAEQVKGAMSGGGMKGMGDMATGMGDMAKGMAGMMDKKP